MSSRLVAVLIDVAQAHPEDAIPSRRSKERAWLEGLHLWPLLTVCTSGTLEECCLFGAIFADYRCYWKVDIEINVVKSSQVINTYPLRQQKILIAS